MGMASVFYDVLNHLVIDSCIHPRTKSEKACVSEHLANASKNDLIIYDRGYPAFWLYAFHLKHNHTFCMRYTADHEHPYCSIVNTSLVHALGFVILPLSVHDQSNLTVFFA